VVFNGAIGQTHISLSLKEASFTVMFDYAEALTYDRAGRLWSHFKAGHTFRRGLDGRMLDKWQADGLRQRRWLSPTEAVGLIDYGAARMRDLRDQIDAGRVAWTARPEDASLIPALDQAGRFDAQEAERDRAHFERVYQPISILPPDQYLALVLQATTGCSFNTCTFCNFYTTAKFHAKWPEDFRKHAHEVRAFLGESIRLRKSVFLGEANALTLPLRRLVPLLMIVHDEFGEKPVYAFLDAFSGAKKSIDEFRQLAAVGLKRVSIGLESGHDPLLRFVRKPGTSRDVIDTVTQLKSIGVGVSLIVMIGLGGDRYAEGHMADTIRALNAMPLDRGDIIYFSELVEHADTPYPALARAEGIRPLTADEMDAQRQSIRAGLQHGSNGPIVSRYDIHEFVY
jgi:hypothetical protein